MTIRSITYDSQDAIPEALRESATSLEGGGFSVALSEDHGYAVTETKFLESLRKRADEKDKAAKDLSGTVASLKGQLEGYGEATPDEVRGWKERIDQMGDDADIQTKAKAIAAEQIAQVTRQRDDEAKKLRDAITEREEKLSKALGSHESDILGGAAFGAATKADAVDPEVAAMLIRPLLQVKRDDDGEIVKQGGKPVVEVVKDGVVQVASDGTPMTAESYVKTHMRQDYPNQFKGPAIAGSGARGGGRGAPVSPSENPWVTGNLTERSRIQRESPDLAKRLKQQAATAK